MALGFDALRIDFDRCAEYLSRSGGKFFYFVCREAVDPQARLHARMIFYGGDDLSNALNARTRDTGSPNGGPSTNVRSRAQGLFSQMDSAVGFALAASSRSSLNTTEALRR